MQWLNCLIISLPNQKAHKELFPNTSELNTHAHFNTLGGFFSTSVGFAQRWCFFSSFRWTDKAQRPPGHKTKANQADWGSAISRASCTLQSVSQSGRNSLRGEGNWVRGEEKWYKWQKNRMHWRTNVTVEQWVHIVYYDVKQGQSDGL